MARPRLSAYRLPPDPDVWADGAMNVKAAEAFLGVKRDLVYALIRAGRLAKSKIGSRTVIARRSLVRVLAEQTQR